jgi:hypothetical protein
VSKRWKNFTKRDNRGSGSGGTKGSGHNDASTTKSYHNGGVEGSSFSRWYDSNLAHKVADIKEDLREIGVTKSFGLGGTKGTGSGGTKGSGSGGTKGSGSGGTKGSGSGGTKGSGSGGTKGSGSGGTKGSGSGGTKGSGSGGTKGSGSGGTKGSGSRGTKGFEPVIDDGKTSVSVVLGDTQQFTVTATQTPQGQLFITVQQTNFDNGNADVDGIFFNFNDNATLEGLNFFPDPLSPPVTGFEANADSVNALPNGVSVPGTFDAVVQFGSSVGSTDGTVSSANFTLWSDNGPLTLDDISLSDIGLLVNSTDGDQVFLTDVTTVDNPDEPDEAEGSGTKGSGSGGTRGSGYGGTKGSGSGGTKGSGSGGTKGSGSGGTKASGSGGTKGSGSGGTKGSGSGGTKGSGSGGTKGSGSGGTKGSGSGGTKGSGSGGTKGSGSGGTKGSGSGGTKGSGSGGTFGGYSQWSGSNASAAADTLPAFSAYPEDDASVDDIMSLMIHAVDEDPLDDTLSHAATDGTGTDLF